MSAASFAGRISTIRREAIMELFRSLPHTVELVSFTVDQGEIQPDQFLDEYGQNVYPTADVLWDPIATTFGHNLTALKDVQQDLALLSAEARARIVGTPIVQYGPGLLYVLARPRYEQSDL